jgi:hypothetical protein
MPSFVVWQKEAESFSQTQGTVASSQVLTSHGRKGSTHYRAWIDYSYSVNGRAYQSHRYRYDSDPENHQAIVDLVAAHPAGSPITIYYDPNHPVDAVLSPGVDARDVDMVFFFTALCLVIVSFAPQVDWPWPSPVAGGVKVITEGMITRVRLPRYKMFTIVSLVAAILSLVAGIMVASYSQFQPLIIGGWLLLAVLAGGAVAYAWCSLRQRSGRLDLVIDEGSRTVQLPLTYKRREQSPLPFARIKSVALEKIRHKTKSGAYYTYAVTLAMTDGPRERLAIMYQSRADSLAAWLKEKLRLSPDVTILNDEIKP